jgi:long-chain fatty acid transport protein
MNPQGTKAISLRWGRLGGLGAGVAALAVAGAADASGFAAARFGGEQGTVVTTNPTALYYNPAGIAFSTGLHLYLDGTLALRHASWTHGRGPGDRPEPAGAEDADVGQAKLFNVFGGPMLGASARLGDLAVGVSLSVPFGGRASWQRDDRFAGGAFPLAADGVQRWHGTEGALTFIYLTAGAAYRLGPLAIGATGNLIRSSVSSTQAKTPTGDGTPDLEREGRAVLNVKGTLGSFAVGAMAELIDGELWLAGSYQAQPGLGPMALQGTLTTVYQGGSTPFPATFHQALPDIWRAGLRYRPRPTAELRLFGEYTRWSVMQTQCVGLRDQPCAVDPTGADATPQGSVLQNLRRKWIDTIGLRAGASGWLGSGAELFGGVGLETAAVPDATLDPGLADAANVSVALGGRFPLTRTFFLAASYTHVQYMDRDNTGASQLTNAAPPTKRADGGGRYTQWIGLVNINVEKTF